MLSHGFGADTGGWLQLIARLAETGGGQTAPFQAGARRTHRPVDPISRCLWHADYGRVRWRERDNRNKPKPSHADRGGPFFSQRPNGRPNDRTGGASVVGVR